MPRGEPSVRGELQRNTAAPTVHSPHSTHNILKVQETPVFLTHQSLPIAFRTKSKHLTVGHHSVLCSRLSRHTVLLCASLVHRSSHLGPLKLVLSLPGTVSPPWLPRTGLGSMLTAQSRVPCSKCLPLKTVSRVTIPVPVDPYTLFMFCFIYFLSL